MTRPITHFNWTRMIRHPASDCHGAAQWTRSRMEKPDEAKSVRSLAGPCAPPVWGLADSPPDSATRLTGAFCAQLADQLPTLLGSASAGMVGRVFCHPIDTVKARLQASAAARQSFWGVLQLHNMSLAHLRGLYRGLGVSMLGSAPATCLYLTSYEVSKDSLHAAPFFRENPSLLYLGAGMLAEAFSCVLWVPIDVIKERMQVQQPVAEGAALSQRVYYRNTLHAVQTIMETERLRGLYKGYAATLLSFGPFSALYFMFYEKNKSLLQDYLKTEELSPQYTLASAATAGAAASLITNPLDMIKLRLQVQRAYAAETNAVAYTGIVDGLTKVIRSEGVLALYKGAGARVAFHAPSTAITMSLFESCRRFFANLLDK